MNKIKIDFDSFSYDKAIKEIENIQIKIIPKLAIALSGYGIVLDQTVFESIIKEDFKNITDIIQASFNSDIDKLSNPISKRNLQETAIQSIADLTDLLNSYKSDCLKLNELGKIVNSEFILTDGYNDIIQERFTTYITEIKEIELYKQHQKLIKEFNKFIGLCSPIWRIRINSNEILPNIGGVIKSLPLNYKSLINNK